MLDSRVPARPPTSWLLGGLGLCVAGVATVDVLNRELDPVAHLASYFVHGPGAELLVVGLFALAVVALAVSVWSARFTRGGRLGRWLLAAFAMAIAVAAVVPTDPVGHWDEPLSPASAVHGIAGWVAFLVFPVSAAVLGRAWRADPRWARVWPWLVALAATAFAAVGLLLVATVDLMTEGPDTLGHAAGLIERVLLGVYVAWLATATIGLRQASTVTAGDTHDDARV